MAELNALVMTDEAGGIAKQGGVPWHCRKALNHFRMLIDNRAMLMGRKTFDNLTNEGKSRATIVLSRDFQVPSWKCFKDTDSALRCVMGQLGIVYVVGGEEIFTQFLPYVGLIHEIVVPGNWNCDKFFPRVEGFYKFNEWEGDGEVFEKDGEKKSDRFKHLVWKRR